jgi:hypothetical protein
LANELSDKELNTLKEENKNLKNINKELLEKIKKLEEEKNQTNNEVLNE